VDNTPIKLFIWDTAGQEKYRAIVSNYFQGCDGVMLLFDLSSEASFRSATTRWLELARSKSPQAQLMLIGNKSDLMQTVS
jgi:small GTP-binding protein